MATYSSILAWRISGTEEAGGLLSMGSHRVRHDLSDLATSCNTVKLETIQIFIIRSMEKETMMYAYRAILLINKKVLITYICYKDES